jgi:hypothetical protein
MSMTLALGAVLTGYGLYQGKQNYDALVADMRLEDQAVALVKVDPTGTVVKNPAVQAQLNTLMMKTKQDRTAIIFDALLVAGGLYIVSREL